MSSEPSRPVLAQEVYAHICEVEVRHDLLQYEVDGWSVWPLLRFGVANVLTSLPWVNRGCLTRRARLSLALQDIPCLMRLPRARYLVKTYTSGLLEQEDGLYKDIWFDDLLRETGDFVKIEAINNPAFIFRRKVALMKSHVTTTLLDLVSALLARTVAPRYVVRIALRLSAILRSECGTSTFTPSWVRIRLLYFYWLKKLYTCLLRRVHPEYVLIADSGEHAIAAAGKQLGIKVVELQHGINDRYHSGYSWTAYALKYKAHMPIPDRLLLYGEHWKRELEAPGFWGEDLRVVGSPTVDRYRELRSAIHEDDICTLVLTTQGLDVERLIGFVANFLEGARGKADLHLYIKLHPAYETAKAPYLAAFGADPRVKVFLGNEGPSTLELLAHAHFHVSISSNCHYEALALGVPTVVLALNSHEVVLNLCEKSHAFLARSPYDLLEIGLRRKSLRVPEEVRKYYYAQGALENMKRELGVKQ